jgi:FdrA protein
MAVTRCDVRPGAYYDSVVLMQLQHSLASLPRVLDAGVVMGTQANKDILKQTGLLTGEAQAAAPDDLIIVVKADGEAAARDALGQVDELLIRRPSGAAGPRSYFPKSLESAAQALPQAQWVLVSVPGRYAANVARQALRLGKHVFLYSDNISLDDEVSLKKQAAGSGLLVMGPDCGTAIVNGVGLGFANRVRRGTIGIVAASGTGLQQVSARIHRLGGGISQALGTGGRDLSEAVGGVTAHQSLDLLQRDPETAVIVLVSKPPAPTVAEGLLDAARAADKTVIVDIVGYRRPMRQVDNLHFVATFDEAAELSVQQAQTGGQSLPAARGAGAFTEGQQYLRGLYSGGTLAYEAQMILQDYLPRVYSNVPFHQQDRLQNSLASQEHTIVDLGEDEFTVGRLHPMMDHDLRSRRMQQEAEDPGVAVLLLDVVLGDGAHLDPAAELAPAIRRARDTAQAAGRHLEVVTVVVGTDRDPQGLDAQVEGFRGAGARVETSHEAAVRYVGRLLRGRREGGPRRQAPEVPLRLLQQPLAAINVGLESFAESLESQGAAVVHVDWRPPAGGDERLMAILERMKRGQ